MRGYQRSVLVYNTQTSGETYPLIVPDTFSEVDPPETDLIEKVNCWAWLSYGFLESSTYAGYHYPRLTKDLGDQGKHGGVEFVLRDSTAGFEILYFSFANRDAIWHVDVKDEGTDEWFHIGSCKHGEDDGKLYAMRVSNSLASGQTYRVYTDNYLVRSIRHTSAATIHIPPARLPAMHFVGDSYSRGSNLYSRMKAYPYVMAESLKVDAWVLPFSGGGYVQNHSTAGDVVDNVKQRSDAWNPPFTFVQLGVNDYLNGQTSSEVGTRAYELFEHLKSHGTELIVSGVVAPGGFEDDILTDEIDGMNKAVGLAAKAAGADLFIDTREFPPFTGQGNFGFVGTDYPEDSSSHWAISADALHPTVGGQEALAAYHINAILEAGNTELAERIQRNA